MPRPAHLAPYRPLAMTSTFAASNRASIDADELRPKLHVASDAHGSDHPMKTDPFFGVATSVTPVPVGRAATHDFLQFIPAGSTLTWPDPVPTGWTDSELMGS